MGADLSSVLDNDEMQSFEDSFTSDNIPKLVHYDDCEDSDGSSSSLDLSLKKMSSHLMKSVANNSRSLKKLQELSSDTETDDDTFAVKDLSKSPNGLIDESLTFIDEEEFANWPDLCFNCQDCMQQLAESIQQSGRAIKDKALFEQISRQCLN